MDLITENQINGMEGKFEKRIQNAQKKRLQTKITCKKIKHKNLGIKNY